jgi:hypothetical protein
LTFEKQNNERKRKGSREREEKEIRGASKQPP